MNFRICSMIIFVLLICATFFGCNRELPTEVTDADNKELEIIKYDSVEDFHANFLIACASIEDNGQGYWPRDIVTYFTYEDKYFVICTYAENKDDEFAKENKLMVYAISVCEGKMLFDISNLWEEIASFSVLEGEPNNNRIGLFRIGGKTMHVSFVCKEYGEERNYYFDGMKMDEVEFSNPFSNETKVLCYGISERLSEMQIVLGIDHMWHFISNSPVNHVEDRISYKSDRIKVVIEVPSIPTSDKFLVEYTNYLADKIEASKKAQAILNGGKIDRRQLYAEIKFHVVAWNTGVMEDNTTIADIAIYDGGKVIDPRPWLNKLVLSLYGDEYSG